MELKKLFMRAALCALMVLCALGAFAEDAAKDRVNCYTTWDDSYFYLAFRVDNPDVQATHKKPNAEVTGDDSIQIFVETNNAHSAKPTPACFAMSVSAAGGSQFMAGNDQGAFVPTPVWTFKYGATVQGTLNNADDIDMGYNVEVAIPWDVLKAKSPVLGDMMSFNVIVRRHDDKSGKFISLSPRVKTEEDALSPAKWVNIVFAAHSFGVATTDVEKILSAKYVIRSPLIDGVISDKEWHQNTSFAIDLPMPEGFVYEAKFPTHRTVFAPYYYWYQADPRKAAPYASFVDDKSPAHLRNFPARNVGPWFSYDRVQWHKDELSDMSAAGVDVVLPVYDGAVSADKGLDCMVSALIELRAEGKPYPLVGMCLDAASVLGAGGNAQNSANVERTIYSAIKAFFDRVPLEYRATAQAGRPRAGQVGYIVFLKDAEVIASDPRFVDACNESFMRDFGCPLICVASNDVTSKIKGFDGAAIVDAGSGLEYDNSCRIAMASVGPGADVPGSGANQPLLVSRMDSQVYRNEWDELIKKNPQWVVCTSWNNLIDGSNLCASREYGRAYVDATREVVKQFLVSRDYSARYIRYNVPKVIPAKGIGQAEIAIRNVGNSPWRASEGYALGYRWYKNGRFQGESKFKRPLERDVPAGDTINTSLGIATVNPNGTAMPEGNYEVRIELIRLSDNKWFSTLGDQPLLVPIAVGKPAETGAAYLTCSAPVMMAAGATYPVTLRVRNDGSQLWPKGTTKLGCKLYKVSKSSADTDQEVPIKPITALLMKDCKPGEIAEFAFDLNMIRSDKKPLDVWKQEDPWSYQFRFDVFDGAKWLSESGVKPYTRVVDVFEDDYGPRIVDCDLPSTLFAGQTLDAKVVVRNTGAQPWDPKRAKLGYHWYHLDGTEMQWDGLTSPFKAAVQPGWPAMVTAKLQVPEYDGRYILVWDMMVDGKWLSTGPLSRGGDILPITVEVTNGKLAFVDIAKLCNVCDDSSDINRAAGDFDGNGASFPAEQMLPDAGLVGENQSIYPAGYQIDRRATPDGRISFVYPDKSKDAKNAVACSGQVVEVQPGNYVALHVVGASTKGAAAGEFGLNYKEGAKTASITMNDWTVPANGVEVAYMTSHRHTAAADAPDAASYLYHYSIPLDGSKILAGITLPKNADMKIVAITLERAALPPAAPVELPPSGK